jgi:predicted GIY-YIG superfamily endonuclease
MSRETVRYVYILASHSRVLYTGITRDLRRRMYQHKHGLIPGFTAEYAVNRLVYFESTAHIGPLSSASGRSRAGAGRRSSV